MKVEDWGLVVSLGREGLGAKVEGATCSEWRVYKVGDRSQIQGRQRAAYSGVREVGYANSEVLEDGGRQLSLVLEAVMMQVEEI
jgi:hypothetical protein